MYNNSTGIFVKRKENAEKVFKTHHNKHRNRLLNIESKSDMCMFKSTFFLRIFANQKEVRNKRCPKLLNVIF
ncbi:hypothetical protein B2D45_15290 [Lactobacillus hilgardii]